MTKSTHLYITIHVMFVIKDVHIYIWDETYELLRYPKKNEDQHFNTFTFTLKGTDTFVIKNVTLCLHYTKRYPVSGKSNHEPFKIYWRPVIQTTETEFWQITLVCERGDGQNHKYKTHFGIN